jgi:hypothetical protein
MGMPGKILVEFAGKLCLIPEAALEPYEVPPGEIVGEILREVGAPPDTEGTELEEKLASWKNPVAAYLPDDDA